MSDATNVEPAPESGPGLRVEPYVVCIIDLLGQSQRLAKWAQLPPAGTRPPAFIEALQDSVGAVLWFKDTFTRQFNDFAAINLSADQLAQLNAEQRDLFTRSKACDLKVQQFSDTFVFYSPIRNAHGDITVAPLFRILAACSMAMLSSLAAKLPLRGAICIGTGTELNVGNFYGPGLANAHHLESKVAGYPRMIVADEVLRFLQGTTSFSAHPTIDQIMRAHLESCRGMITTDHDGRAIVDFLGIGMRGICGADVEEVAPAVDLAHSFVRQQVEQFAQVRQEQLKERYQRLEAYIGSRIHLWRTNNAA